MFLLEIYKKHSKLTNIMTEREILEGFYTQMLCLAIIFLHEKLKPELCMRLEGRF